MNPAETGEPRLRVAYVSPLPPLGSGVADYSAELLPHLARHLDLQVFAEPGSDFTPPPSAPSLPVHPVQHLLHTGGFDAVLYQLGNNADFHLGAYRALFERPGIVVLHEFVLHHMIRELTLAAGDPAAYLEEVRYGAGRSGAALARRSLDTGVALDVWSYPLFERVVDASLGVLVHNELSRRRILASRPLALVRTVPFPWLPEPLPGPDPVLRSIRRGRLGLPDDAFVVATFGFMTRAKRLDAALRAFARFAADEPRAHFLLAGDVSKDYDLDALVPAGLRPRVHIAGRLPMDRFRESMAEADVALVLRYPPGGETSAVLMRLLGLGRPTVVTDAGSFQELPDDVCAKVPPDETEEETLLAYLRALAADPDLRRRMGDNARWHVEEHHQVEAAARAYAEAVREIAAAARPPVPAVPPLAPYPPDDVLSDLIAAVTADVVDLGAGEEDEEILRAVAATLADLDLDRASR
jgi:glycosyltransferase involved in cell wall biosynthesis